VVHTIEIDDDVYEVLRHEAEPFTDTPNTVLRRLLGIDQATSSTMAARETVSMAKATPAVNLNGKAARRAKKPAKAARPPRAAAGMLLPESEYELPLLKALDEAGGSAPSRSLIDRVGELVEDRLTDLDREHLPSGGIRWQSRIQFVRLRLIERGLMEKNTPRGVWSLSPAGRDLVKAS
jgi:hypothetical protein